MQRIGERFLDRLVTVVPLHKKHVLEIGCGDGRESTKIAGRASFVWAIDPDIRKIREAKKKGLKNVRFSHGSAEALAFDDSLFDAVIFTLSFHHVCVYSMEDAIDEAVRVTRLGGYIVFLEPGTEGSFFDAEIEFDACDGDERLMKGEAYDAMMRHPGLQFVKEFFDGAAFKFESLEDFVESMHPKGNHDGLETFLKDRGYILRAKRRINVFQPK